MDRAKHFYVLCFLSPSVVILEDKVFVTSALFLYSFIHCEYCRINVYRNK
jgi:hypothetical protein